MSNVFCGVDFHKRTCTIFTCDKEGKQIGPAKRVPTDQLAHHLRNIKSAVVGIEGSGGVNHTVKNLRAEGIDVRILNASKSRAIGHGGKKTDSKDAETIANLLRSNFAPEVILRSQRTRDMSMLITARQHVVDSRVTSINHIRGLLREYGIVMDAGAEKFLVNAKKAIEDLKKQNPILSEQLLKSFEQVKDLKKREEEIDKIIEEQSSEDVRIKRIRTIPGLGPLGAYLMVAVIDDISRFPNSSKFASYLGLVPRENSSGDKRRLGSVTKAGNETLRRYLIHGARAVLKRSSRYKNDPMFLWAQRIEAKRGTNKATVALAHKLARIAFAVCRDGVEYTAGSKLKKTKKAA